MPPAFSPDRAQELENSVVRKVLTRLIPFLAVLYMFNLLDRGNITIAALTMKGDLGFDDRIYGWGVGIFFIGYFLFEVPSNLIMERVGARLWIARIMFTWGIVSTSMMFVKSPLALYTLRFLLGVAEAGFFPGIILDSCRNSRQSPRTVFGGDRYSGTLGRTYRRCFVDLRRHLGLAGLAVAVPDRRDSVGLGDILRSEIPARRTASGEMAHRRRKSLYHDHTRRGK